MKKRKEKESSILYKVKVTYSTSMNRGEDLHQ